MHHGVFAYEMIILHNKGKYDDAENVFRKGVDINPLNGYIYYRRQELLLSEGKYREALQFYQQAIDQFAKLLGRKAPADSVFLGYAYARLGEREKAVKILNDYLEKSKTVYERPLRIASLYVGLGDIDNAFVWIGKAFRERDSRLFWIKTNVLFDPVRFDPRYNVLLKKMGLPED